MASEQDKCKFCGHESTMPFYSAFLFKRKRYIDKDFLRCPTCRKEMSSGSGSFANDLTPEEREVRQVGQPCLSNCGGVYQPKYGFYDIRVCKECGKTQ